MDSQAPLHTVSTGMHESSITTATTTTTTTTQQQQQQQQQNHHHQGGSVQLHGGAPPAAAAAASNNNNSTGAAAAGLISHDLQLPPGFRFHPTDEELVVHYLARKLASHSFRPIPIVTEVDLYKFDPWELPQQAAFGEKEWYFFSPRDRKYPNGVRPNRAAASGYWKATGTDKIIHSSSDGRKIGVKKALVFYKGRAPKGVKSNWIMHEYRLVDATNKALGVRKKGSLRLDDWVLCRIYKKKAKSYSRAPPKPESSRRNNPTMVDEDILASLPEIDEQARLALPRLAAMSNGDPFVQALLSGHVAAQQEQHLRGLAAMNQYIPMDLLRSKQMATTEMLLPKDPGSIWQIGNMLDHHQVQQQLNKEDQNNNNMVSSQQSTTTSLALLDNLHRAAARSGLSIDQEYQQMEFQQQQQQQQQQNHNHHHHHPQQSNGEVVDDTFSGQTPTAVLFPSPSHMNFNNGSFNLHAGAY